MSADCGRGRTEAPAPDRADAFQGVPAPFGSKVKRLLASTVPPLQRLLLERDRLEAEHRGALEELEKARTGRRLLEAERDRLRAEKADLERRLEGHESDARRTWVPPGHFYSPIPDMAEIRASEKAIFDRSKQTLPAIEMNPDQQFRLLDGFQSFYGDEGFVENRTEGRRYYHANDQFPYGDAFFLYCMMRYFKPRRIVEVGAGFSTCVMLDARERLDGAAFELTVVDPHPQRLLELASEEDLAGIRLITERCQDVPVSLFADLDADDILFVDSSHVAKTGSDVNFLFFEVLPRLKPGVVVHFHDVPFPFEYGEDWVYEGRAWNEAYLARAFLQFNGAFELLLYPSYLTSVDYERVRAAMPRCVDPIGPSLWLRKIL